MSKRTESSPPSPEFDCAPIWFIAIARVSCASGLIEPRLIAADAKRLNIASFGSTSEISIGALSDLNSKKSRINFKPRLLTVDLNLS